MAVALFLALVSPNALAETGTAKGAAVDSYRNGQLYEAEEDWYGAVEAYLSALDKNPNYADPMIGLARSYYELGEYREALVWTAKARKFRGDSIELATLDAFIRVATADHAAAEKGFYAILARQPNNVDARFGLALLDLAKGKSLTAVNRYEDALRLSPLNARALLSLALVYAGSGRESASRAAIEQALRAHPEDPQVQYFAAFLAARSADWVGAQNYCRSALQLRPAYAPARHLLATALYRAGQLDQAAKTLEATIAGGYRDLPTWYLLACCRRDMGDAAKALSAFKTALSLRPDDEMTRLALEEVLLSSYKPEDKTRETYANYHFSRAQEYEERNYRDQALIEYRRGLRVYPYSAKGRSAYAALLKKQGSYAHYLSELELLQADGLASDREKDNIEIYGSMLSESVSNAWKVDQFGLQKRSVRIAFFQYPSSLQLTHADSEANIVAYLKGVFLGSSRVSVLSLPSEAKSFAEAFRAARQNGADYFFLVKSAESDRDVSIEVSAYCANTGSKAGSFSAFRTGNDRLKNTSNRIYSLISQALPSRGTLIKRRQNEGLISLGGMDGLKSGDKFLIIKKGELSFAGEGFGLEYVDENVVGKLTVTKTDEEVSAVDLSVNGYFDMINSGDEIVPADPKKSTQLGAEPSFPGLYNDVRLVK
jgi:tetratricopeptide (TPR) repeat protein